MVVQQKKDKLIMFIYIYKISIMQGHHQIILFKMYVSVAQL